MSLKIFNIEINISFLFLLVITLMIFIDKSGLIIPMLISISLHEFAHILAMLLTRCRIKRINLIPCCIEISRDFCDKTSGEIFISISGPLINIVLFFVFYKIDIVFSLINLCLGLFNILPLTTLDGGEILKTILLKKFSEDKVNLILKTFNLTFGVFGLVSGIVLMIENKINFTLILFSIYIIILNIIKI